MRGAVCLSCRCWVDFCPSAFRRPTYQNSYGCGEPPLAAFSASGRVGIATRSPMEGAVISRASQIPCLGVLLLSLLPNLAMAADVTVRITNSSGETASVTLDTDQQTWIGTNGRTGAVLKARAGIYKAGTNLVPGFATKGTGILAGSDGKTVEAFFYNLIPSGSEMEGNAHMVGSGQTGKWKRR